VKIPKPKEGEAPNDDSQKKAETDILLPQTLVRIPIEHAPMLQQSTSGSGDGGD